MTTRPWNSLGVFTEQNLVELKSLFTATWWASSRTEDEVRRVIEASDIVYGLTDPDDGRLVAFARVLTDFTFLAVVLDVVVDPGLRGQGVGAALMDAVTGDPRLAEVRSIELVCQPELFEFYRRWGFTTEVGSSMLMRRTDDPLLRNAAS